MSNQNQMPEFEPNIDRANENIERQAKEITKLKAEITELKANKAKEPVEQPKSETGFVGGTGLDRAIRANAANK